MLKAKNPIPISKADGVDIDAVNMTFSPSPSISYVIGFYDGDARIRQEVVTVAGDDLAEIVDVFNKQMKRKLVKHARAQARIAKAFEDEPEPAPEPEPGDQNDEPA